MREFGAPFQKVQGKVHPAFSVAKLIEGFFFDPDEEGDVLLVLKRSFLKSHFVNDGNTEVESPLAVYKWVDGYD